MLIRSMLETAPKGLLSHPQFIKLTPGGPAHVYRADCWKPPPLARAEKTPRLNYQRDSNDPQPQHWRETLDLLISSNAERDA
jgi:hypothetical protein